MRLDFRARAAGKSHDLAGIVAQHPGAVLIVHCEAERARIVRRYFTDTKGVPTPPAERVLVAGDRRLLAFDGPVYVDNIDLVLASLLGRPVELGSLTRL